MTTTKKSGVAAEHCGHGARFGGSIKNVLIERFLERPSEFFHIDLLQQILDYYSPHILLYFVLDLWIYVTKSLTAATCLGIWTDFLLTLYRLCVVKSGLLLTAASSDPPEEPRNLCSVPGSRDDALKREKTDPGRSLLDCVIFSHWFTKWKRG